MSLALNRKSQLGLWVIAYLAVSMVIGTLTTDSTGWYRGLAKASLNPPPVVFPIVWSSLYILIASAGFLLWEQRQAPHGKAAFALFALQTVMNWAWSFIFFKAHLLALAYVWILALVILVAINILLALRVSRVAALLLIPYLVWIAFASYLSGSVWMLN